MAKNPAYKTLKFESLTLAAWISGGRTMINLRNVSDKHYDQMRLSAYAATYFPEFLEDTPRGLLLDIRVLSDLMTRIGLQDKAGGLPIYEPPAVKPVVPPKMRVIEPPMRVDTNISPERIRRMYQLMQEGHSQTYAARVAGLGEATASRLRRGQLNSKMPPPALQAWSETFGKHVSIQKKMVRGTSQSADERNAALMPQLYQLIRIKNLSFAAAAQTLAISPSKAHRLSTGTYPSMGIKTLAAYKTCFESRPEP